MLRGYGLLEHLSVVTDVGAREGPAGTADPTEHHFSGKERDRESGLQNVWKMSLGFEHG